MDLEQLAAYLHRDVREVSKLANRGYLPGKKVGGEWRFTSSEINHWIETQMHAYTEEELTALERRGTATCLATEPLVCSMLSEGTTAIPLRASTKASVLRELVKLAEQSWQVYDADALLVAVKHREELGTTALESGVAIPHPHRPLSEKAQADSIIVFARTAGGIPFGAPDGGLTDLFFLVSCRDSRTHLRVLARLSRMMLRIGFLDELRSTETPADALALFERTERDLLE
ncbi:MAG: helix-turn-helix domain-containing protein [Planctomycetes bacterium]|nr:helix-turn-helix domain-containing protein [Planctomycetota bacterium]